MVAFVEGEESQEDKMVPNYEEDVNELEPDDREQLSSVVQRILLTPETKTLIILDPLYNQLQSLQCHNQ